MRKIIYFICVLLIITSIHGFATNITYSFSFKEIAAKNLLVECVFQGNKNGVTELILPLEWGNQSELYKNIHQLTCVGHKIKNTKEPHIKVIHHKANEQITIHYAIELLSDNIGPDNYFRPIGDSSYFYGIGHALFIIPSQYNSQEKMTLKWKDAPPHWKIANSFGQALMTQDVLGTPYDLKAGAYLAGEFQMVECHAGQHPIHIALRGNWPFSPDELTALIQQIFTSQRNFWNDNDFPHYLVSVIPIHTKNCTGGIALTNTFSLFLNSNYSKQDFLKRLAKLISHEHFHTWNGHKIWFSEPERSMYWFTEGFTEYYSVKLNYQHGITSQEEYAEHVNEILRDYFSSPAHHASNETIVQSFWSDFSIQRLPYNRGFALALYLDTKIQSQAGSFSLDHFMHALLELTKQKRLPFSSKDLSELMAHYIDQDDLHLIKECIIQGKTIPVFQHALGSDYHLEWVDYVGFNVKESLAKGIIEGVTHASIPFQAGLRNGLKILHFKQDKTRVTVTLVNRNTISYDLKELKQVPQYIKN
jgi:predicted metalloprotease with PDZ domain